MKDQSLLQQKLLDKTFVYTAETTLSSKFLTMPFQIACKIAAKITNKKIPDSIVL